ncbi:MAG: hypothetical protein P8M16_07150 [Acidimicrobiales bacterium]|nr:hypothetical protein [Acidimicrobiales bacterium]
MNQVRCLLLSDPDPDIDALTIRPEVLSVDVVDHERLHLLTDHSIPPHPPIWTALVWTTCFGPMPPVDRTIGSLTVNRHPVWGGGLTDTGNAIMMISLVVGLPSLDADSFKERYLDHAKVARAHHGFDAYRQNVVEKNAVQRELTSCVCGVDAVSEILLADEEAWRDRFYTTTESARAIGHDVAGFLNRDDTSSTLVRRFSGLG